MKRKPKVGEKIFLRDLYVRTGGLREVTVSKVGRSYFTLEELTRERFHIDTWKQDTERAPRFILYGREQDYLDKVEAQETYRRISATFGIYGRVKLLTLDQLRRIEQIVNESKEQETSTE